MGGIYSNTCYLNTKDLHEAKNNICHLNTKDLVVVVFFVVPSSLHHRCVVVQYPKKFVPIMVPAPVVPCPSSLVVAC